MPDAIRKRGVAAVSEPGRRDRVVEREKCLKETVRENVRRWSTWTTPRGRRGLLALFRLGAPESQEGAFNITLSLQDDGVGVLSPHLRPIGLAPPGPAWVTLGEPASPPWTVLGSSQAAPARSLSQVGFDTRPRRRVFNP